METIPLLLTHAADAALILASLGAAVFCLILSRRLSRLSSIDNGLGGAIAVLSAQVDDMNRALSEMKSGTQTSAQKLEALNREAQQLAEELELMLSTSHDLAPSEAPDGPTGIGPRATPRTIPISPFSGRAGPRRAPARTSRRPMTAPRSRSSSRTARARRRPGNDGARSKRPRRIWQRISLLGILSLFVLSGLLRLGAVGFAQASAAQDEGPAARDTPDPLGQCAPIGPLQQALDRVTGRAEALDAREAQLEERAAALAEVEARVSAQLATLEATEKRLESLLALSDTAAEDDLSRLTQVYETMDPDDAAALFSQMDPGFAAGFLARMQSDAAAGVLAALDPAVAHSISVLIATRNASAPVSSPPAERALTPQATRIHMIGIVGIVVVSSWSLAVTLLRAASWRSSCTPCPTR